MLFIFKIVIVLFILLYEMRFANSECNFDFQINYFFIFFKFVLELNSNIIRKFINNYSIFVTMFVKILSIFFLIVLIYFQTDFFFCLKSEIINKKSIKQFIFPTIKWSQTICKYILNLSIVQSTMSNLVFVFDKSRII